VEFDADANLDFGNTTDLQFGPDARIRLVGGRLTSMPVRSP